MTGDLSKSWCSWIFLVEFWYSTSLHTAINLTPFQALYGITPSLHLPYFPKDFIVKAMDLLPQDREPIIQLLKHHLTKAQQRMVIQGNKHQTDRSFQIGGMVYLKLCLYCQSSVVMGEVPKLATKYLWTI